MYEGELQAIGTNFAAKNNQWMVFRQELPNFFRKSQTQSQLVQMATNAATGREMLTGG